MRPTAFALLIAAITTSGCGTAAAPDQDATPIPSKPVADVQADASTIYRALKRADVWATFGMDQERENVVVDDDAVIVGTNRVEGTDKADGARFLICDVLQENASDVLERRTVQIAGFGQDGGAASLGIC